MKQRTTPNIRIKRWLYNDGEDRYGVVVTVPITEKCRRKFTLMSEDTITLSFTLPSATRLVIGDSIDDELFGKYYLTKEYLPKFNNTTGGYDYEVTFESAYMLWRNWLFCLVATNADNETQRMESNWRLTDKLSAHAEQICANLSVLGQGQWNAQITAEKAGEAKYIAYNGISLIDALNAIADTFECEWWVTTEDKTIHFGKCEGADEPMAFTLGDNVESMDIQDNRNTYANRLYVFGGTQNIPVDYDRSLVFTASEIEEGEFADETRPLTLDMFTGAASTELVFGEPQVAGDGSANVTITARTGYVTLANGGTLRGSVGYNVRYNLDAVVCSVSVAIYRTDTLLREIHQSGGTYGYQFVGSVDVDELITGNDVGTGLDIRVYITLAKTNATITTSALQVSGSVDAHPYGQSRSVTLNFGGANYPVTFTERVPGDPMVFTFNDAAPSGFGSGSAYRLTGLTSDIPAYYYTEDYQHGTLTTIGARRLHLPLSTNPNRSIDTRNLSNSDIVNIVESAVVFEGIYPRVDLEITDVRQGIIRDKVIREDGTTTYENNVRYYFKVRQVSGAAFAFSTRYLLDGEPLRGVFEAPTNASAGNLLSGMTFELGFNDASQEYGIVRNEDYGVRLPDGTLRPQVGDRLTLTGWNPRAMDSLGLVAAAESELATKGAAYVDALKEGQFTFTCRMMSDWPMSLIPGVPLYTNVDEPFHESANLQVYVRNDGTYFALPIEGARVTIHHNALHGGSKSSRIIGYEFKLDMPWDAPVYTVGETQAYSRLAKIEKEITKLQ